MGYKRILFCFLIVGLPIISACQRDNKRIQPQRKVEIGKSVIQENEAPDSTPKVNYGPIVGKNIKNKPTRSPNTNSKTSNGYFKKVDAWFRGKTYLFFILDLLFLWLVVYVFRKYMRERYHYKSLKSKFAAQTKEIIKISSENNKLRKDLARVAVPVKPTNSLPPITAAVQKSFDNVYFQNNNNTPSWKIVGASSIGQSHVKSGLPCQDYHVCKNIGDCMLGWGVAVVCDGAGSAENSQIGSKFCAEKITDLIISAISKYSVDSFLPSDDEWAAISRESFKETYLSLQKFAKENVYEFNSLACTVNLLVFSPIGLLSSHIGDGRAGYCLENDEWNSIMTPHKGEESNQTIFITSGAWLNENLSMSQVSVPESQIVRAKVKAFTILSDGCESHAFDCSKLDPTSNLWHDPNKPSEKFYSALVKQLRAMQENRVTESQLKDNWIKFVEAGTEGLKEESDDKTLILGVSIN